MLVNTLNTNEIKNSAGTELEFSRLSNGPGRETVFRLITELPYTPYRLTIKHIESGKGISLRRRSVVRFDKTIISPVDLVTPVTISGYEVLDTPIGALTTNAEPTNIIANLMSFTASLGASTTILYDGTGNGAMVLLNGDL